LCQFGVCDKKFGVFRAPMLNSDLILVSILNFSLLEAEF
jgi:hypothetical protein